MAVSPLTPSQVPDDFRQTAPREKSTQAFQTHCLLHQGERQGEKERDEENRKAIFRRKIRPKRKHRIKRKSKRKAESAGKGKGKEKGKEKEKEKGRERGALRHNQRASAFSVQALDSADVHVPAVTRHLLQRARL